MTQQLVQPETVPIQELLEFYDQFAKETFARGNKQDSWLVPANRHPECSDFEVRSFGSTHAKGWIAHCSTRFNTQSFLEITRIEYEGFPVWMCRKDGKIRSPTHRTNKAVDRIRKCLHEAWSDRPTIGSFQPIGKSFSQRNSDDLFYISSLSGNIKEFTGKELIRASSGKVVFKITLRGNLLIGR